MTRHLFILATFLLLGSNPLSTKEDGIINKKYYLQTYVEVFYKYPPQPTNENYKTKEIHSTDVIRIIIKKGGKVYTYDSADHIRKKNHKYLWKKYGQSLTKSIRSFAETYDYQSQRTTISDGITIIPSQYLKKKEKEIKRLFDQNENHGIVPQHSLNDVVKSRHNTLPLLHEDFYNVPELYLVESYLEEEPTPSYTLYATSSSLSYILIVSSSGAITTDDPEAVDKVTSWINGNGLSHAHTSIIQERVNIFRLISNQGNFNLEFINSAYAEI